MKEIRNIFSIIILVIVICGCKSESSHTITEEEATENIDVITSDHEALKSGIEWFTDENYLYGLRDLNGNILADAQFLNVGSFHEGWAPVFSEEFHGFCDTNGNLESLPPNVYFYTFYNELGDGYYFEGASQNRIIITNKKQNKFGFISDSKEIIVPCIYDDARMFSEGLAAVSKNGKFGFIDLDGNMIIEPMFQDVGNFSEGLAAMTSESGLVGFIDKKGNEIIEPQFEASEDFINGLCLVYFINAGGIGFINSSGEIVIEGPFDEAQSFYGETTLVREGNNCYYINKYGERTEDGDCDVFFVGC